MLPIEQKTLDFIAEIDRVDNSESVRLLFQRFLEAGDRLYQRRLPQGPQCVGDP